MTRDKMHPYIKYIKENAKNRDKNTILRNFTWDTWKSNKIQL